MNITLDKMKNFNLPFTINANFGLNLGSNNVAYIDNDSPILVSACHSVRQLRDDNIKPADTLTGPYVKVLTEYLNINGIYRTHFNYDDPNAPRHIFDEKYKSAYFDEILMHDTKCMVDLHGAAIHRPFDVEICTLKGHSCEAWMIDAFYENLRALGLTVSVDQIFTGGQLIMQTSNVGIDSVALEINRRFRGIKTVKELEDLKVMLLGISNSIEDVKKYIR